MKKSIVFVGAAVFACSLLFGCEDNQPEGASEMPAATLPIATGHFFSRTIVEAFVNIPEGIVVDSVGFCWSENPAPRLDDNVFSLDTRSGIISGELKNTTINSKYWVRVFFATPKGIVYGDENNVESLVVKPEAPVTDHEGNTYQTIRIGKQVWMAENLRTTSFRNGQTIPNVKDNSVWIDAFGPNYKKPRRCYYDNDSVASSQKYGVLYNQFVVQNPSSICPNGWHIPSFDEWLDMVEAVEFYKSGIQKAFAPSEIEFTNGYSSIGFNALCGGWRHSEQGDFVEKGNSVLWWTSSMNAVTLSFVGLDTKSDNVLWNPASTTSGLYIRCIKD
jgi:uncharacterized protein (TIGR02145 family)